MFGNKQIWSTTIFFLLICCGTLPEEDQNRQLPFLAEKHLLAGVDQDLEEISISTTALGKPILMQVSQIVQRPEVEWNGSKSRIVEFIKRGRNLIMLEATKGLLRAGRNDSHTILARFPINEASSERIKFDFNAGMKHIFLASDWYTQDFENNKAGDTLLSAKVETAYIERTEVRKAAFLLDQVVRIDQQALKLRYYFSYYKPDSEFIPYPASRNDYDSYAFFEISPTFNSKNLPVVYATKFALTKKIEFAISANTPPEYQQAVKDGILYWNRAFGHEVAAVSVAPPKAQTPNYDYNIVQWIDNDDAGYAYADAQSDPLTGQILHGQVFFPSIFAISGRKKARRLLDTLNNQAEVAKKSLSINGLQKKPMCHFNIQNEDFKNILVKIIENNVEDQNIREISEDYVRAVIAHEVGHVLGLRHNFAGNLGSNLSESQRNQAIEKYVVTQDLDPELITSSSIMEYQSFIDEAMSGHLMRSKFRKVLTHDKLAIKTLYQIESNHTHDRPLFCTDSQTKYFDCNRNDYGNSAIDYYFYSMRAGWEGHSTDLLNKFIRRKSPKNPIDKKAVSKVILDPEAEAWNLLVTQARLIQLFTSKPKLLHVEKQYPTGKGIYADEISQKTDEFVEEKLNNLGGVKEVFSLPPASWAEERMNEFKAQLRRGQVGTGAGGDYAFSEEEIIEAQSMARRYFKQLPQKLAEVQIEILSGAINSQIKKASPIRTWSMDKDLIDIIEAKIKSITFKTASATIMRKAPLPLLGNRKDKRTTVLSIPKFTYPSKLRRNALKMLHKSRSDDPMWKYRRLILKESFETLLKKSLQDINIDHIDVHALDKDTDGGLIEWIIENKAIKNLMG